MYRLILLSIALVVLLVVACAGAEAPTAPVSSDSAVPLNHWLFTQSSSRTSINSVKYFLVCRQIGIPELDYVFDINIGEPMAAGEGEPVPATTTVSGQEIDIAWETWINDANGITTVGEDAKTLANALEKDDEIVKIEFMDKPELSQEFDVSGLLEMMEEHDVDCFK